jgi:predicted transcriptional regulator
MAKLNGTSSDSHLEELKSIKRLLAFSLLKSGTSQVELAAVLGVAQPSVSRMFPASVGRAAGWSKRRK